MKPILVLGVAILTGAVVACVGAQERDLLNGLITKGQDRFIAQGCYGCHTVGKFGTPIGPDLSHIGARYTAAYLMRWLEDPSEQRPTAHMPKLELDPPEAAALAAYLASLK
jgi:cbb3-type cytochrome oxidase cytochrome c subunit